jgi:formate dehydrogenase major subunit
VHGLEFLLNVNEKGQSGISGKVIVIGGGFTAMDCARTAWRIGAESVKVFYRRSVNEMLITKGELEELEFEGIPMEFMVVPKEYIKDDQGNLKAILFIRNELGEKDESGRRRPIEIPGSEFEVEANHVLLATGQFADAAFLDDNVKELLVDDRGFLKEWGGHRTPVDGLFLAGDFSQGASSLISAIGHARMSALVVDEYLMGEQRMKPAVFVEDADATGRIREMDAVPQTLMPMAAKEARTLQCEVEKGFGKSDATEETQRCYLCHYKFEIDHDRCIYCDWCIKAKPRPRCILKVRELVKDDAGKVVDYEIAAGSEDTQYIYINQEDCIRCGACVNACPVNCISVQKVSKAAFNCNQTEP